MKLLPLKVATLGVLLTSCIARLDRPSISHPSSSNQNAAEANRLPSFSECKSAAETLVQKFRDSGEILSASAKRAGGGAKACKVIVLHDPTYAFLNYLKLTEKLSLDPFYFANRKSQPIEIFHTTNDSLIPSIGSDPQQKALRQEQCSSALSRISQRINAPTRLQIASDALSHCKIVATFVTVAAVAEFVQKQIDQEMSNGLVSYDLNTVGQTAVRIDVELKK